MVLFQRTFKKKGLAMTAFVSSGWLDEILKKEQAVFSYFFGNKTRFKREFFAETLKTAGASKVKFWQELDLEPHYFPVIDFSPENWGITIAPLFLDVAAKNRIFYDSCDLKDQPPLALTEGVFLVDSRKKPAFSPDRRHNFPYDQEYIGKVLVSLRERKVIKEHPKDNSSRFGISANEFEEKVKPELAKLLAVDSWQIREERVIECAYISGALRYLTSRWMETNDTFAWFAECLESAALRLCGSFWNKWERIFIESEIADCRSPKIAIRPIIVLARP